jgi:hypothetical protein
MFYARLHKVKGLHNIRSIKTGSIPSLEGQSDLGKCRCAVAYMQEVFS